MHSERLLHEEVHAGMRPLTPPDDGNHIDPPEQQEIAQTNDDGIAPIAFEYHGIAVPSNVHEGMIDDMVSMQLLFSMDSARTS
jgi:hypothetical protein